MTLNNTRPPIIERFVSVLKRAWEYEKNLPRQIRNDWNKLVLQRREGRALTAITDREYKASLDGDTAAGYRLSARYDALVRARAEGKDVVESYREARKVGTRWWMNPPNDPTPPETE